MKSAIMWADHGRHDPGLVAVQTAFQFEADDSALVLPAPQLRVVPPLWGDRLFQLQQVWLLLRQLERSVLASVLVSVTQPGSEPITVP